MTFVKEAPARIGQDPKSIYEGCTILALGSRGVLNGRSFCLVGRTCVRGRRGVCWNEWLGRFDKDASASARATEEVPQTFVLAESGGGGMLMVYEERSPLPATPEALVLGAPLDTGFIVVERGHATRVARWGEVEDSPGSYRYADLSSSSSSSSRAATGLRAGTKATIEYVAPDEAPHLFVGKTLTLADLGLDPRPERPRFVAVPELSRPKGVELWLAIDDEGELAGARSRVIGVVSRSLVVDPAKGEDDDATAADGERERERDAWDEYLLHDARIGFRWLVVTSDGHWNLIEPIEAGVVVRESEASVSLDDGTSYEVLSEGTARVDWAAGELPWEVTIGELVRVRDYVSAPWILTKESSADEVSWSRGTHLDPDDVAKAFGKRALPKPIGRAPNAPLLTSKK